MSVHKFFGLFLAGALVILGVLFPEYQGASPLEIRTNPHVTSESHLLEIGQPTKARSQPQPPAEIKVISYNIRWRSGNDLHRMIKLFQNDPEIGGATILALQEVDRNKKRSGNKNTAALIAEELGMYYAWAAPPATASAKEEETGVSILSAYPLSDVRRLVLPHKGPGGKRRVAVGATVKFGQTSLRVYSVHGETRLRVGRKIEQMKAVIEDLANYEKDLPAIVLGDLNTWEPAAVDKTFKLFSSENFQTPFDRDATFSTRVLFVPIKLKLDWIWVRNLEATSHGIDREIKLSDHWPLWIVVRQPKARADAQQTPSPKTMKNE